MAAEGKKKQILFEGRFQKRGSSVRTWHVRYFKLYEDFTFDYYKAGKALNNPQGSGDLSLVKEVTYNEQDKIVCFETKGNNRNWYFIFEDKEQRIYWMYVAKCIIDGMQNEIEKYADSSNEHHMKVVIIGMASVGKTSFLLKYMYDYFEKEYDPTLEDLYKIKKEVDGEKYFLQIMDTAGQEEFRNMAHAHIREADALIVCYSIADRTSFEHLKILNDEIKQIREDDADHLAVVIVGTKVDLANKGRREISTVEGQRVSEEWGCQFLETSSIKGTNIEEAFLTTIRYVNIKRQEKEANRPPENETGRCVIS